MTERNSAAPVGFGPHIRALREAADMKQKDVAARVGVSQAHLSSMEAKAHLGYLPAPEIVSGLACVFGVSEASLLQASGYLTDDASAASAPATDPMRDELTATLRSLRRAADHLLTFEDALGQLLGQVEATDARIEAEQQAAVTSHPAQRRGRAVG